MYKWAPLLTDSSVEFASSKQQQQLRSRSGPIWLADRATPVRSLQRWSSLLDKKISATYFSQEPGWSDAIDAQGDFDLISGIVRTRIQKMREAFFCSSERES